MGTNSLESAIAFAGHPGPNAMFQRLFLAHPARVNESYFQHQRVARSFALPLLTAACRNKPLRFMSTGYNPKTAFARMFF